jgi:carbon starvation protein
MAAKVAAFVDGSANFLQAMAIPPEIAVALMGVLVASFAGTTLDTACRLHRYVIQELAATFVHAPQARGNVDAIPITANPMTWLTNKHGATILACVLAFIIAALPTPETPVSFGQAVSGELPQSYVESNPALPVAATSGGFAGAKWWLTTFAGRGGLILWPLFGATNQLLAGLSFLVIAFFLWRRNIPVWFIVIPMLFMLVVPAWAMLSDLPTWMSSENPNWVVIVVGISTLILEAWMLLEALFLWPKVRGVLETGAYASTPASLTI